MMRFEKIKQLRREKGFDNEKIKTVTAWEEEKQKVKNLKSKDPLTTPETTMVVTNLNLENK